MSTKLPAPGLSRRKIFLATSFGHAIEWYEFSAYGFTAVYLAAVFFPSGNPTTGLLATFGVFGLTFFIRPLGAVVFGPLADRIGRKRVLVIVLLLMSGSTALIGALPGYATIGAAAPLLLVALRALQNFSAAGELGSVSAFIVEYSGPRRRGFGTSWLMFSATIGFTSGSALVSVLVSLVGDTAMQQWGWRIPFLLAAPLGLIGLYIRLRLEDTPEFRTLKKADKVAKSPLREALTYRRQIFTTMGLAGLHASSYYIVLTFMASYITTTLGFGSGVALAGTLSAAVATMAVIPVVGALSDRVGRRPILITASAALVIASFPVFSLITTSPTAVVVGQVVLGLLVGTLVSTTLVSMTEIFPARVRVAGSSFAYSIANAVLGGSAPFIATFLIDKTGSAISPAAYLVFTSLLGLAASLAYRDVSGAEAVAAPVPDPAHTTDPQRLPLPTPERGSG
ncbi:MHS family MFS transporter [Streptomyces rapamycinicus]|uniref:Putative proline/betaine transporter n=1 Tax=Streptomyces rhizosphaericus TaxID=114699 RepID=A0A6G4AJR8_9ACTN|nr:MHS family MFS transporter [Streptomyces rhizosphaericus]